MAIVVRCIKAAVVIVLKESIKGGRYFPEPQGHTREVSPPVDLTVSTKGFYPLGPNEWLAGVAIY